MQNTTSLAGGEPAGDTSTHDSSIVKPWFLGDVVKSAIVTAGRDVQITLMSGNQLSVQQEYWPDFTDLIQRVTRWFVGRGFVFEKVADFLTHERAGYFRLVADAGLGKTAIAAELARRYRAPAYFFSTSAGRTSTETALNALSAQVIARYGLPHATVPLTAGATSDWLYQRLKEAAAVAPAGEPIVLVLDALDEADAVPRGHNWAHLPDDLPDRVYIVVTHREGSYPLKKVAGLAFGELTITREDPGQRGDVEEYLRRQAQRPEILRALTNAVPPISDAEFVTSLANRSQGNFMYLAYVLDSIAKLPLGHSPVALDQLPSGLDDYYQQFWDQMRPAMTEPQAWEIWDSLYRPVIELLAIAGEPVTPEWLGAQTGQNPRRIRTLALDPWTRFLAPGNENNQDTWSIVHRSFADFLALQEKRHEVDLVGAHRTVANYYAADQRWGSWATWDDYGLHYAATHIAAAARGVGAHNDRRLLIERLVALLDDPEFRKVHLARLRAPDALRRDLEQALALAVEEGPSALALLSRAALAVAGFRTEVLDPTELFKLAEGGDVEAADRQLGLYDLELDSEWHRALRLSLAWLGFANNPVAARALRSRVRTDQTSSSTLSLLQQRVDATLDGTPEPPLPNLPPPPPAPMVEQIVARLAGTTDRSLLAEAGELMMRQGELLNRELLGADDIEFLAEADGPLLVALVVDAPTIGADYLDQYLRVHSRYSYVTYRRGSLWVLLNAVLRHPDPRWVRATVAAVGRTALVGGDVEFEEALGFALMGLAAQINRPDAAHLLQTRYARDPQNDGPYGPYLPGGPTGGKALTLSAANVQLHSEYRRQRNAGDPFGTKKRRLGALAEAIAFLQNDGQTASNVVAQALALPFGFAGYQAPACLSLAESIQVARRGDEADVPRTLRAAREAAHNIQDSTLCARTTARVNAMTARWWPAAKVDILGAVDRLRRDPSAAEFSAMHVVGETYPERIDSNTKPLPAALRDARTLGGLAVVYQRPLAEFRRLNPTWADDAELPDGMLVNVPDPRLAAMVAARLAAQALVDPRLGSQERISLIWSLVPIAAINPTALDSVLARLILVDAPQAVPLLPDLEGVALRSAMRSTAAEYGSEAINLPA